MTYINARLPRKISAGFKLGPDFKTLVVPLDNGREQRNKMWRYPKWKGTGNMGAFTADDRQSLINMFVAAQGKWACFRVFDPTDYFVTNETLAPVIGTSTPVQLVRNYPFPGSNVYGTALIQAPVASTVVINRNGSPVAGTLNDQLGLFTPSAPWVAGTFTWTGQYDRWMRFDSDWGAFTANAMNAFTADIDLVEVPR